MEPVQVLSFFEQANTNTNIILKQGIGNNETKLVVMV